MFFFLGPVDHHRQMLCASKQTWLEIKQSGPRAFFFFFLKKNQFCNIEKWANFFPQILAKLVQFSLQNQKLPNCFVENKDINLLEIKSTGQDGYMWGCQCLFFFFLGGGLKGGEVFLNLKNLIFTHIRIFVKKKS